MTTYFAPTGDTRSSNRTYTHCVVIDGRNNNRRVALSFHSTEKAAVTAARAAAKWAEGVEVTPVSTEPTASASTAAAPAKAISPALRALVADELDIPVEAVSDRVVRNWSAEQAA